MIEWILGITIGLIAVIAIDARMKVKKLEKAIYKQFKIGLLEHEIYSLKELIKLNNNSWSSLMDSHPELFKHKNQK